MERIQANVRKSGFAAQRIIRMALFRISIMSVLLFPFMANPIRFARDMYSLMRRADEDGVEDLYVRMPAPVGIGVAIRDRLTKAAHRDADNETEKSG